MTAIIKANLKWKGELLPLNLKEIRYIVIHHIEHPTATIEDVHGWHIANGWSGCGYNEFIDKNGVVYIGRGYNQGAHTLNWNSKSLGIALQGDYEKENKVPEIQYNTLIERVKHHLNNLPSGVNVVGHYELSNTKCPGGYFMPYLERLKKEIYTKGVNKLENISEWAKDAQQFVIENKISDGTQPKLNVTREQLWTMLYNFYKLLQNKK